MMNKKRLVELSLMTIGTAAICWLLLQQYVNVVLYHTHFPVEARLLNSEGKIAFVPFGQKDGSAKSPEEIAVSSAVLVRSGLWVKQLVMAGDKDYAFCPFGRVYILRGNGLDDFEVESSTVWHGEPHEYPFPGRKGADDGA
ncbi:MAG TPA: hypothetical protein VGH90_00280 [Chthoniobacteraceae bacterium]|jgi:hypothetical protein